MIQLTYYLDCKIKPNHCIQNIENYLSTLTSKEKIEFNDVKEFLNDEAEFGIKVDLSNDIENLNNINYCKITRDNITRYYFITSKQWRSESVYLFGLELDVVNTYQEDVMNKNLYKQVKISRRHKDRWKKSGDTYVRVFDKVDEELGDVTGEVESKTDLTSEKNYVAYKALTTTDYIHNYTDKIFKYFLPKTTQEITTYQNKTDIEGADFNAHTGKLLFFKDTDTILKIAIQIRAGKKHWFYANGFVLRNRYVSTSTGIHSYIDIYPIRLNNSGNFYVLDKTTFDVNSIYYVAWEYLSVFGSNEFYVYRQDDTGDLTVGSSYDIDGYYSYKRTVSPTSVTDTVYGYNSLNKVDSQLLQLQELPINISINCVHFGDNELITSSEIGQSSNELNLTDNYRSITKEIQTRDVEFESKLYGSYVRKHTLMYDSFGLEVQPEYMNNPKLLSSKIAFALNMSNNFAIFSSSIKESKPYSNIVLGSRNNQATIYTSDYLNYMRTGYNFDQKQHSLQKIQSTTNLVSSLIGTGTGIAMDATSKSSILAKSSSITGKAVGAVNSIAGNIISNIKNDNDLAHKRQEAMNNTPNLNGSDDLALFNYYSGNTFKYIVQKPTDEVLNSIYDLFYYSGYADNLYYAQMPAIKTREYFNYLQCDIGYININNHKERIRILEAFQGGITFEWNYNSTWLLEGNLYENWETSIK